ncbi:MAG: TIGR02996 domain-containing protein [Planctomycetota bacterium]|nr:TIGR02996 domain-containing protein [Planctomycetota bacterium]
MADQRFRELERRAAEDPGDGEAQVRLFGEQIRHGQVDWRVAIGAISAVPNDDTPRLLFANWLEEAGNPRGEFIRLQCELAAGPFRSKRWGIKTRSEALFKEHSQSWIEALGAKGDWTWNRGFAQAVQLDASELKKHSATIFSQEPIDSVSVNRCKESLNCLKGKDWLSRIRVLKLRGAIGQSSLNFLRKQSFPRLERLNLGDCRLSGISFEGIYQSKSLKALNGLSLSGNNFGDSGLAGLEDSLLQLDSLYLSRNQLTDRALEIIGESPACKELKRLSLSGNVGLTDGGLARFLETDCAKSLSWIDLEGIKLSDTALNELRVRIQTVWN